MANKVFTPAEASRALPLVRRIVSDILPRGKELHALRLQEALSAEDEARAADLIAELEELFAELDAIGCSFRCPGFDVGIVDFPGIIDGELVHLCWRDDEPALRYYHAPQAGFAGRKPIPQELLTSS